MKNRRFSLSRRRLLQALGGLAAATHPGGAWIARAAGSGAALNLRLEPQSLPLRDGATPTPVWALGDSSSSPVSRIPAGAAAIQFDNATPVPAGFQIRGLDATAGADSLQWPIRPDARAAINAAFSQPGTYLLDPRLLGDGAERPIQPRVLVVDDGNSLKADRDEVLLIEDWKIGPDGKAFSAGRTTPEIASLYTINRKPAFALTVRPNERVRLRLVNGCQRLVVALKVANHTLTVIAIDSRPAEPFVARDGQIILAPGSRVDAILDAALPDGSSSPILLHDSVRPMPAGNITTSGTALRAAPLPPPGAPAASANATIDLKSAQRVDLSLDPAQWQTANAFDASAARAFRVKKDRAVVVSVTNPKTAAATLYLPGQHVRLLDRLDDGWKPFWLDTVIFQPGQTQRIAFNPQATGNRLLEMTTTAWSSPQLLRAYAVE